MQLYNLIFIINVILFTISFLSSRKNILSPSCIFTGSFLISSMFVCMFPKDYLSTTGENDIRTVTFLLILIGEVTFIFGCTFSNFIHRKSLMVKNDDIHSHEELLGSTSINIILVFSLICVLLATVEFYINTKGDMAQRFIQHRRMIRYQRDELSLRGLVNALEKIDYVLGHIIAYDFAKNHYGRKYSVFFKNDVKEIIIIVSYMLFRLLFRASRGDVIEFVIFIIFTMLLLRRRTDANTSGFVSYIKVIAVAVFLGYVFVFLVQYAGIDRHFESSYYVFQYIAGFAYCGLLGLNYYINEPSRSAFFGKMTFPNIYLWLNRAKLVPSIAVSKYGDFFVPNRVVSSNTLTIFGRWYADFGFFGTLFFTVVVALVVSGLYNRIMYSERRSPILDIIFIRLSICLAYAGYDDHISDWISLKYLTLLILYCIVFWLLKNVRIKVY